MSGSLGQGDVARPRPVWRERLLALAVLIVVAGSSDAADPPSPPRVLEDLPYDAVVRPTDPGATAPYDAVAHRPIELVSIALGRWAPDDAELDVFVGVYTQGAGFLRIDVTVAGLVNPPGSTDVSSFDPFRYGPHPMYGFIEMDVDDDNETGGEIDVPQYRYLANIARFGGLPEDDAFAYRVAGGSEDVDGDFMTAPYIERSGEEFHLALLGGQFTDGDVSEVSGNGDLLFDADEIWVIEGVWFHRAHGFEPFSFALGGTVPGEYAPRVLLRFAHDSQEDRTAVSLVFPLNNNAAGEQRGETPEPMNYDPSDQASLTEALRDLIHSGEVVEMFPTGMPEEMLILPWKDRAIGQFLDPADWRVTALLGTTYTTPGNFFIWTDAYPNVIRGNVNGENGGDQDDAEEIGDEIAGHDADDGAVDGRVILTDYARGFSVLDVNHDGAIDGTDALLVSPVGDGDLDGDVDLGDFAVWQRCRGAAGGALPCLLADLDADGDVDGGDATWFLNVLTGPEHP